VTHSQQFIEQLRCNFEEELEKQQKEFSVQVGIKQMEGVKAFENVIVLEFDKILQSILLKGQTGKV